MASAKDIMTERTGLFQFEYRSWLLGGRHYWYIVPRYLYNGFAAIPSSRLTPPYLAVERPEGTYGGLVITESDIAATYPLQIPIDVTRLYTQVLGESFYTAPLCVYPNEFDHNHADIDNWDFGYPRHFFVSPFIDIEIAKASPYEAYVDGSHTLYYQFINGDEDLGVGGLPSMRFYKREDFVSPVLHIAYYAYYYTEQLILGIWYGTWVVRVTVQDAGWNILDRYYWYRLTPITIRNDLEGDDYIYIYVAPIPSPTLRVKWTGSDWW